MSSFRKDWLIMLILAIIFIVGVLVYPLLPARVPMHWNATGQVDGYGSRFWGAFGLPLTALALYLLFIFLPRLDPKKENHQKFSNVYGLLKLIIILFLTIMYLAQIGFAIGYPINIGFITKFCVGLIFAVVGNYFGKLRFNYFVGIRTPWTLANEQVWTKTHRMAGPLWVGAGGVFIFSAFFNAAWTFWLSIGALMLAVVIPFIFSYLLFTKLQS
ncbi:SdpI family protein [Bacillota bacterium LX-D]|nr:SdpI family protein [Bacillota bacterium LX-D]